MAKKVPKWETPDGQLFDSQEDADAYERDLRLKDGLHKVAETIMNDFDGGNFKAARCGREGDEMRTTILGDYLYQFRKALATVLENHG